jgi:predicted transposase/invertase (TIGR01784 family)
MEYVFKDYRKYVSLEIVNIYLNRILEANKSIFGEVLAMNEASVQEILYAHFEKNGTLDRVKKEEKEIGMEIGRQEGMQKGRQEGRQEGRQDVAIRLLERNSPIEEIIDITGLTRMEVESLTEH